MHTHAMLMLISLEAYKHNFDLNGRTNYENKAYCIYVSK